MKLNEESISHKQEVLESKCLGFHNLILTQNEEQKETALSSKVSRNFFFQGDSDMFSFRL